MRTIAFEQVEAIQNSDHPIDRIHTRRPLWRIFVGPAVLLELTEFRIRFAAIWLQCGANFLDVGVYKDRINGTGIQVAV